jgi:hypothetical protein
LKYRSWFFQYLSSLFLNVFSVRAIESVQKRVTKQFPGMKKLLYPERLKKLGLPTLAYRRIRGDMIEVYKIRCFALTKKDWHGLKTSFVNLSSQSVYWVFHFLSTSSLWRRGYKEQHGKFPIYLIRPSDIFQNQKNSLILFNCLTRFYNIGF